MISTRRRSSLPNFQKKNCVNLLLTALQPYPKTPYFAIKHKFLSHISIPMGAVPRGQFWNYTLQIKMGFQLGRPDRPEQFSYRG
jgi:hypothetical protein